MYFFMYMCMYACMSVSTYVSMNASVYAYIHTYMYIHTHIHSIYIDVCVCHRQPTETLHFTANALWKHDIMTSAQNDRCVPTL